MRRPRPIKAALSGALAGLSAYPATAGTPALREAIAGWIERRHQVSLDPATEILPVNGSREALFAFAQTVIDPRPGATVVAPNPFYQIYEGAALLAGAQVHLVDQSPANGLRCDWTFGPGPCLGAHAAGLRLLAGQSDRRGDAAAEWRQLFELSDRHGFVIASDECYSEIYLDETAAPAQRSCGQRATGPPGSPAPDRVLEPFQALQRPRHALGFRCRRRRTRSRRSSSTGPTTAAR